MEDIIDSETHYLRKQYYITTSGETKIYYDKIKRFVKGGPQGRPSNLPDVDTDKLKELRNMGVSWTKICEKFDVTAHYAKKLYESVDQPQNEPDEPVSD